MSFGFKVNEALEWCAFMPFVDRPQESPVFTWKGNQWTFKFLAEKFNSGWYAELYMDIKNKRNDIVSSELKFRVGFKSERKLSLGKGKFTVSEHSEVWFMLLRDLQAKLPSDYSTGNWIKFVIKFDGVVEPVLQSRKETVDRGMQTASYFNADISLECLPKDFSELFDTGMDHDILVKCGERSMKAHKIVLSTRSQIFKAMLHSDMLESSTGVVHIQDTDVNYFQDFIRYLYTDEMPELSFEKAKELYETADKYGVKSLMLRCSDYLQDNLSQENAFQSFVLAHAHSDENMKEKVKAYILDKKMYLQEEPWLPFCESFPDVAIEVYKLSYKEKGKQIKRS